MEEDIKMIEYFINNNWFVNGNWASIHRNAMADLEDSANNLITEYKRLEEENNYLRHLIQHYRLLVYSRFGKDSKGGEKE